MSNFRKAIKWTATVFPPVRGLIQLAGRIWTRPPQLRDLYSRELPSSAAAFELFKNEWASAVPGFETGKSFLFDDSRLRWLEGQVGSFQDKRVLELGPLEGGHTWMMEHGGAHVLAIEANQRAFLKCLIVKNALCMRTEFLYGDFRCYLEAAQSGSFDLVTAIGVLYHMTEPVKLLYDIARVTDTFAIWTHYYDPEIHRSSGLRFDDKPRIQTVEGVSVQVYQQNYLSSIAQKSFCGGSAPISFWLTKDGLLGYVENLGFQITIGSDDPNHVNGPSILFVAKRQSKLG